MGNERTDFDRLLAGELGADDPTLGHVAAFLSRVQSSAEVPSVALLEEAHVARVRAALPALDVLPRAQRRERRAAHTRRFIIATVAGVFAVLTAGVGVAAAMGVDPIAVLRNVQFMPGGPLTPAPEHDKASVPEVSKAPDSNRPTSSSAAAPGDSTVEDDDQGQGHESEGDDEHGKPTSSERGHSGEHATAKPDHSSTKSDDDKGEKKDDGKEKDKEKVKLTPTSSKEKD